MCNKIYKHTAPTYTHHTWPPTACKNIALKNLNLSIEKKAALRLENQYDFKTG